MAFDAKSLLHDARKAQEDGPAAVLHLLEGPIDAQQTDVQAALALVWVLAQSVLPHDETARLFGLCLDAHPRDDGLAIAIGNCLESARDIDDLNAPPPAAPVFARALTRLREIDLADAGPETRRDVLSALATVARLTARQNDAIADRAYARLVDLSPTDSDAHYLQGLFFKTRGRFAEGAAANRRAIELHPDGGSEAAHWNLGICATGAGDGETALRIWRDMGNKLKLGPGGLPEGGYPVCKVRVAQRPLAERGAQEDDPGPEENIWIERLSPCHGIVRCVMYSPDIGTDFGDTILFDGAPITYHLYGDAEVPVFPHLATLARGNFHFYDFSATQGEGDAIATANQRLDDDINIYSQTSSVYHLCAACWRDVTVQHARHETQEHKVVHGRIAAHPDIAPDEVLARIDAAHEDLSGARLFSPDLCEAASQPERALLERRRFDMLRDA